MSRKRRLPREGGFETRPYQVSRFVRCLAEEVLWTPAEFRTRVKSSGPDPRPSAGLLARPSGRAAILVVATLWFAIRPRSRKNVALVKKKILSAA
jgi:hypothetical protein